MDARARIEELAGEGGFDLVRFSGAEAMAGARAAALESRAAGRLADLHWMTDEWIERATDPGAFLAGANTVVLLAITGHAPDPERTDDRGRGRVARYARGRDYHRLFESKLRRMTRTIREELGGEARATVDYGPLLERPLAARAGLGWLGKSTMLLAPGFGPWVLLGAIATTLEHRPRRAPAKDVRVVHALHRRLPDGRHRAGRGRARFTALHQLPHDREPRADPARAATQVRRLDLRVRRLPRLVPGRERGMQRATPTSPPSPPTMRSPRWPSCCPSTRRRSASASGDGRCSAPRATASCGTPAWRWGTWGRPRMWEALTGALGDGAALVRGHAAWALGEIARRQGGGRGGQRGR